ncbi:MAG TPA: sigma-70 family RNA polymerase sigma factor [Pirellulaceae bacterium]|nr:sigma-70 family RNA polymerase sigma factor [Pirellulaceae bacterium]
MSGDILAEDVAWPGTGGNVNVERIDTEALQTLIESHGAGLALYARQWCNAPEDALQEALIELLRQNPVPDHPVAWLFKTIRYRAINLTRGERRRDEHHRQASEQRDAWFMADKEPGFNSEELQEVLSRLPDLEREIVVARIWGELPFERIADLVHISSSSVHRRYRGALLLLHEMLDGDEDKIGQKNESPTQV